MGTSSSKPGPGSNSPLVPPWGDDTPDVPLPEPEGQRFRGFRTVFGRFVGGDRGDLRPALGRYARTATGGSAVGPRRFGPANSAGGALFDLLSDLSAGGTGADAAGVDLSGLTGQTMERAAQAIAEALSPDNADADRVASCIQEALAEALPDAETFDPAALTADQIVLVLVEYLTRVLFLQVTEDAAGAWAKSPSGARTIEAENELFDLVRTCVDTRLSPRLNGGVGRLSKDDVAALLREATVEVWREWEGYE